MPEARSLFFPKTRRLVRDSDLGSVSGRYYSGVHEERAHPQAYDADARRRLRELSERLCFPG